MICLYVKSTPPGIRVCALLPVLLLCLLMAGCTASSWHDVSPHYDETHPPLRYEFHSSSAVFLHFWASANGTELWAVGEKGTIVHYNRKTEQWEQQISGTSETPRCWRFKLAELHGDASRLSGVRLCSCARGGRRGGLGGAEEPEIQKRKKHAADGEFEPDGGVRRGEKTLKAAGDDQHGNGAGDEP